MMPCNYITLLLFPLLMSGCGDPPKMYQVDPGLESYVEVFRQSASSHGRNFYTTSLLASFVPDEGTGNLGEIIGECDMSSPIPTVTIGSNYWNAPSTPDRYRQALIDHELGHCWLKREHKPSHLIGSLKQIIDSSIMNPVILDTGAYEEYYQNELFDPNTAIPLGFQEAP
jgi:hypothetical protein